MSWTPADRVASAALDISLSETHVPLVNVTHPKPVPWRVIFEGVRDALVVEGQTEEPLPLEGYEGWMRKLEGRAFGAKERDFGEVVSFFSADSDSNSRSGADSVSTPQPALKILPFLRGFLQPQNTSDVFGHGDAEAGNGLHLVTDKARLLSSTMRLLSARESEWLGPGHARAWVMYWKNKGFLQ